MPEPPRLSAGTRLGPYEIVSPLGAGGMGEVWRAKDTRLDRTVAVKVLAGTGDGNAELRERFGREARAVSALQHPHVCALFDVGTENGTAYLVMEYLEGETLADRLAKGRLGREPALRIGAEIASALAAAHRHGIVHRDLKPANVMLTKTGVKLLDFGLAKLRGPVVAVSASEASSLPTELLKTRGPLTGKGTILGTLQYMAPEQLEGKEADARSDLFALGAVLYEMATGQRAFTGKSSASLIAAILEHEPAPVSSLEPLAPKALERLVAACLAKDPQARWESAHDAHLELEAIARGGPEPTSMGGRVRALPAPLLAAGAAALGAALAVAAFRGRAGAGPVTRLSIAPPAGESFAPWGLAISPDGRSVAYLAYASDEGARRLFVRRLDRFEETVAASEDSRFPAFTPSGRELLYTGAGTVQRVRVEGGNPSTLARIAGYAMGIASTAGGDVYFPPNWATGLDRVRAVGGPSETAVAFDTKKGERGLLWPELTPDGKAVLVTVWTGSTLEKGRIEAIRLATGERHVVMENATTPRLTSSGHLLFARGAALWAVPFDADRLAARGTPVSVVEGVTTTVNTWQAQYDVSKSGTLAYMPGGLWARANDLSWLDRGGRLTPAARVDRAIGSVMPSPDGARVLVQVKEDSDDAWVLDLARETLTRVTFGGNDEDPIFTADGARIIYSSTPAAAMNLFWKSADGTGEAERLTTSPNEQYAGSCSPDGRLLAFVERDSAGARSIHLLELTGERKERVYLSGPYSYSAPRFSRDGKRIAFTSTESGRNEVYVQAFPGHGGRWQVSTAGGYGLDWAASGDELLYTTDGRLFSVRFGKDGAPGKPTPLETPKGLFDFAASPKDDRILVATRRSKPAAPEIRVVLNWMEELKAKVPVR